MRIDTETDRLRIRTLVPDDCEAAFVWCGDPKVNRFMLYSLYHSVQEVRNWIESTDWDSPDSVTAGFVLKQTNELIGCGGLVYMPDRDVWKIGYNLRADQWRNGYTSEALTGIIEYVGAVRPIKAIEGEFAVENPASGRVMEKLGMVYVRDSEYEKFDGSARFRSKVYRRDF